MKLARRIVLQLTIAFQLFVVLLFSFGVRIDLHSCNGNLVSIGILAEAATCNSYEAPSSDPACDGTSTIHRKSCCSEHAFVIQQEFESSFHFQPYTDAANSVVLFEGTDLVVNNQFRVALQHGYDPDPPSFRRDILLQNCVFLI